METNDNAKKELMERYTRKPYPTLVKPTPADNDESEDNEVTGYQALIEQREKKGSAPRFRIVLANGQSYGCGYAYLLGWLHTPPHTFTLYTTTHIFTLSGKHMNRIENALMRDKVKQLREYNPKTDTMPANGEPFIESIKVSSRFEQ